MEDISYVGMDVHKASISVAVVRRGERVGREWRIANTAAEVRKLARRLVRESGGEVRACYEAGPCGYGVQRQLEGLGVECVVVAPSLTPVKPESE